MLSAVPKGGGGVGERNEVGYLYGPKKTNNGEKREKKRTMCTPLSVSTMPESSPTLSAKAASSNGVCMAPRLNGPRSPPCFALLQSLSTDARAVGEGGRKKQSGK